MERKIDAVQLNYDVGSIMSSQLMLEEGINQLNHSVWAIVDNETNMNINVALVRHFFHIDTHIGLIIHNDSHVMVQEVNSFLKH